LTVVVARQRSQSGVIRPSTASEHASERGAELCAHSAVDEEVSRIGEQDDEVDEDTGSSCRSFYDQTDAKRVVDYHHRRRHQRHLFAQRKHNYDKLQHATKHVAQSHDIKLHFFFFSHACHEP